MRSKAKCKANFQRQKCKKSIKERKRAKITKVTRKLKIRFMKTQNSTYLEALKKKNVFVI